MKKSGFCVLNHFGLRIGDTILCAEAFFIIHHLIIHHLNYYNYGKKY
jgi:hypothetical protein